MTSAKRSSVRIPRTVRSSLVAWTVFLEFGLLMLVSPTGVELLLVDYCTSVVGLAWFMHLLGGRRPWCLLCFSCFYDRVAGV